MILFPIICESYGEMSRSFFLQYQEAVTYLRGLNCSSWDFFEHCDKENAKFDAAYSLRYHSALAAIVFQALAVESFINLYGACRIGEKTYYTEYEIRGATTEYKIKKICKDYLKASYPTKTKAYSKLISLLKKRDAIVHSKPHSVEIDGKPVPYETLMKQTEFVFKDIDDEMTSYDTLKSTLKELEHKDQDLIQELAGTAENAITQQIIEMIKKSWGLNNSL